jgi:hypothetical protein
MRFSPASTIPLQPYSLDSFPELRGTTAWTVVPRLSWD